MRYLASSELQVKGPAEITRKLAQPTDFFQDVKVIAFPVAPDYNVNDYPLFHLSCLSSQKKLANIMNLLNFVSQYPDESSCKAKFK
ncbi:hypothetical protein EZS27_016044, partial [termite gut metagenome]